MSPPSQHSHMCTHMTLTFDLMTLKTFSAITTHINEYSWQVSVIDREFVTPAKKIREF